MRLRLDAGAADPPNSRRNPGETVELRSIPTEFSSRKPSSGVINILWLRTQSNKPLKTFVTPFYPKYRPKTEKYRTRLSGNVDYTHEREWRVPHDFKFKLDQVQFVVLPDYREMARFPQHLKDRIGREKFILFDVYQHIETLWPTHITD